MILRWFKFNSSIDLSQPLTGCSTSFSYVAMWYFFILLTT